MTPFRSRSYLDRHKDSFSGESARRAKPRAVRVAVLAWSLVALLVGGAAVGAFAFLDRSPLFRVSFSESNLAPDTGPKLLALLTAQAVGQSPRAASLGADHLLVWNGMDGEEVKLLLGSAVYRVTPELSWKNRTVAVSATKQELWGVWCAEAPAEQGAGRCYGFDKDGILVAAVPRTSGSLILTVHDVSGRPRVLGQRVVPDEVWMRRLSETLRAVEDTGERVTRVTVREQSLHEWTASLASGPILEFSFDFMPEKLTETIRKLGMEVPFGTLSRIDFRVPGRLYYR